MYAKKTLKLFKYSPNYKVQGIVCIIYLFISFIWGFAEIDAIAGNGDMGAFLFQYFFLSFLSMPILQLAQNLMCASYIRTSPSARKVLTRGCAELMLLLNLIIYSIFITGKFLLLQFFGYPTVSVIVGIPTYLIMVIGLILYTVLQYKKPLLGLVPYVLAFGIFFFLVSATSSEGSGVFLEYCQKLNPILMIVLGYIGIAGCVLIYLLIIRLTYRLPYSDRVMNQLQKSVK